MRSGIDEDEDECSAASIAMSRRSSEHDQAAPPSRRDNRLQPAGGASAGKKPIHKSTSMSSLRLLFAFAAPAAPSAGSGASAQGEDAEGVHSKYNGGLHIR